MVSDGSSYTFGTVVASGMDSTRERVTAALREQGFGILTEIDVQATLREKLGVEGDPYLILGACNPQLAHRALEAEPSIGALLPCNVVLRAEAGGTRVEIMDPIAALQVASGAGVAAVAAEARERLQRVAASLEAG